MLIRADARALPLRDRCVQCVVTSPPYFGLRDYGNAGQIGLESTPDAYVRALVEVFREVRRVLKDDGTCWLNLGDSYASHEGQRKVPKQRSNVGSVGVPSRYVADLKAKDLIGVPWRVAFALQADGWYLRADIIWHKPNPMPESCTDRPTKSHEYLFLLTKCERYQYDADAIRERAAKVGTLKHLAGGSGTRGGSREGLKASAFIARHADSEYTKPYTGTATKDYAGHGVQNPSAVKARIVDKILSGELDGRNKRSVWTIPTLPYAGAHFATMPEALVEPCILAGCPLGGLVLDPFCGTFTVGAVAARLSRLAIGIDLSYQGLARQRTRQRGLSFVQPNVDDAAHVEGQP